MLEENPISKALGESLQVHPIIFVCLHTRFILLRADLSQPTWPHVLSQARDSPPLQTTLDSRLLPSGDSLPQGALVPVCWHSWVSLNSSSLEAVSLWLAQRALEKDVWGSPWGVLMDGST